MLIYVSELSVTWAVVAAARKLLSCFKLAERHFIAGQLPNTMIHDPDEVYKFNFLLIFLTRNCHQPEKISAKKLLDKTCIPA